MAIGQPISMVDARQRVLGTIDYTLNVRVPGAAVARLVCSPHPHARIVRIDADAARRVPGVLAIVSNADLPGLGMRTHLGRAQHSRPILARDRVRYAGEPVVAIAAIDADAA